MKMLKAVAFVALLFAIAAGLAWIAGIGAKG